MFTGVALGVVQTLEALPSASVAATRVVHVDVVVAHARLALPALLSRSSVVVVYTLVTGRAWVKETEK